MEKNNQREKFICENCGIEKNETHYYFSRIQGQKYMKICKDCFIEEFKNSKDALGVLRKYNIPFFKSLWDSCNDLRYYIKAINSLPQYRGLGWKDSKLENEESEQETNFYDKIVNNLKKEAEKLNNKLSLIRENLENPNKYADMNIYIATLKSLKETLDLISKYDWKLMHSEYETDNGRSFNSNPQVKQIAVWEQNHDNQIRNHKIWNVVEVLDIATKITKETGNIIGGALKNIDTTSKEKVPMYIDFNMIDVDMDRNSKNMGICSGKLIIYYMDKVITLTRDSYLIKDYAFRIKQIVEFSNEELEKDNKEIVLYIDSRNFGICLYDELIKLEVDVQELNGKYLS